MNSRKIFVLCALFLLSAMHAFAGKGHVWFDELSGSSLTSGDSVEVRDDLFPDPVPVWPDTTWLKKFAILKSQGRVILGINADTTLCFPQNLACSVTVRVYYYDRKDHLDSADVTLTVNFDKTTGKAYKEMDVYQVNQPLGVFYLKVKVLSICNPAYARFLYVRGEIEQEKYKPLLLYTDGYTGGGYEPAAGHTQITPTISGITYNFSDNTINVSLLVDPALKETAVEYDLEWTFIEAYNGNNLSTVLMEADVPFDLRNNTTRVTITDPNYKISHNFEKGYLIFRVRAVGRGGTDWSRRTEGFWSLGITSGFISNITATFGTAVSGVCQNLGHDVMRINQEHLLNVSANDLNWQYQCTFAEEGKKKEAISYFDGSLRGRQSVVKSEADNDVIVQDKIYDYQGRQAIEVLPVPINNQALTFYAGQTRNLSNQLYSAADFDMDASGNTCGSNVNGMSTDYGAAKYYSSNNSWKTGAGVPVDFHNYVPVANGFPFVQTEFTPDNTGRPSRQSMVGINHKLDSHHETEYEYATPTQTELDMLFGSEAGYYERYKKNVVKDPNGQYSISYIDPRGKVIATSLAGVQPTGMSALPSNVDGPEIQENYLMRGRNIYTSPDSSSIIGQHSFMVYKEADYKFFYSLHPQQYQPGCVSEDFCTDCVYNLEISITNNCEVEQLKGEGASQPVASIKRKIGGGVSSVEDIDTTCQPQLDYAFSMDSKLTADGTGYITVHLTPGKYTITRTLSIDDEIRQAYLKTYLASANCKPFEQFEKEAWESLDTNACATTCEKCTLQLGTQTAFVNARGIELANTGKTPTTNDTAIFKQMYADRQAFCASQCNDPMDLCKGIEAILVADMTPGGQYAKYKASTTPGQMYEPDGNENNVLASGTPGMYYANVFASSTDAVWIGQTQKLVKDLTLDEFISFFKPEWAQKLIVNHPEHCHLQWCNDNKASNDFDAGMLSTETYDEAKSKGYLNPFGTFPPDWNNFYNSLGTIIDPYFQGSGSGASQVSDMWGRIIDYRTYNTSPVYHLSMWELPVSAYFCSYIQNDNTQFHTCINSKRDSIEACGDMVKDRYWQMFRALYYSNKIYLMNQMKSGFCNPTIPAGREQRINKTDATEVYTGDPKADNTNATGAATRKSDALDKIQAHCDEQCTANADYWMEKLKDCNFVLPRQRTQVRAALIDVCKKGCDLDNPLGASTIKPGTSATYVSFEDVLKHFGIYVPGICDNMLITMPKAYGHNYFAYESPYADTCSCDNRNFNSCTDTVTVPNNHCPCENAKKSNDAKYAILMGNNSPKQYACNTCIGCTQFRDAYREFVVRYPDLQDTSANYLDLFENFLNVTLGMNMSFIDYIKFAATCMDSSVFDDSTLYRFRDLYAVDTSMLVASNYDVPMELFRENELMWSSLENPAGSPAYKIPFHIAQLQKYLQQVSEAQKARSVFESDDQLASTDRSFVFEKNSGYKQVAISNGLMAINQTHDGPSYATAPGLDECGCNKLLALAVAMPGLNKQQYADAFNQQYGTSLDPDDLDKMKLICCKSQKQQSVNIQSADGETCTPGEFGNWPQAAKDKLAANFQSNLNAGYNIHLPIELLCQQQCKVPLQKCGCDALMNYRTAYNQIPVGPSKPATLALYIQSQGVNVPNADDLLALCDQIYAEAGDLDTQEEMDDYIQGTLMDANRMSDFTVSAYLCDPNYVCNPPPPTTIGGGGGWCYENKSINCQDLLAFINTTWGGPIDLNTINNYFTDPTTQANLDQLMQTINTQYFIPTDPKCAVVLNVSRGNITCVPPPHPGWPSYFSYSLSGIDIGTLEYILRYGCGCEPLLVPVACPKCLPQLPVATCDSCVMPTRNMALMGNFLNQLVDINYNSSTFTSNGQTIPANAFFKAKFALYNHYNTYFDTKLYDGLNESDLKYKRVEVSKFNGNRIKFKAYDGASHTRNIYLAFAQNKTYNSFLLIRKIISVHPACFNSQNTFIIEAEMDVYDPHRWATGPTIPPQKITVELVGTVENIELARSYNCCARLCNKPISRYAAVDSCKATLLKTARMNAWNNYNRHMDSLRVRFLDEYTRTCRSAFGNEQFRMKFRTGEYHYTLYYYDQIGNLVKTVPPAGVNMITSTTTLANVITARDQFNSGQPPVLPVHTLVTTYQYNTLNQLIAQGTPDAGASQFFYDKLGRIVFSRNAKQALVSKYSYTVYDNIGRITDVGEIQTAVVIDHTNSKIPSYINTLLADVSNVAGQITQTYYDNPTTDPAIEQHNLRNRVSYMTYKDFNGTGFDYAAYYSYDIHGNVSRLVRQVTGLGLVYPLQDLKTVDYDYDLVSGKVNNVYYQQGMADQYIHTYEYDEDNRLTRVYSSPRAEKEDLDATYQYYRHGPLARSVIGQYQVQGIDYAYTINGWLKTVNSGNLSPQREMGQDGYSDGVNIHDRVAKDVYGFILHYFENDYTAVQSGLSFIPATAGSVVANNSVDLYNGNIKMMTTAIGKFMESNGGIPLASVYTYDQLNRIADANYYNNFDVSGNAWQSSGTTITDYRNTFTYDANGNILTQKRNGVSSQSTTLDDLTYEYYANTNKLKRVSDAVDSRQYTDDIDAQPDANYTYDAIGNLIKDKAEEIANIDWNVYGKITRIQRVAGSKKPDLEFAYSPDGHRVLKIVVPKTADSYRTYTYYMRDAQGNIMATYERVFNKIIDYDSLKYAAVNDSIIKYSSISTFGSFIATLHSGAVNNSGFNNSLETSLESIPADIPTFLYANDPSQILNATSDTSTYRLTMAKYDSVQFLTALIPSPMRVDDFLRNLCACMTPLSTNLQTWQLNDPDGFEYFMRALFYYRLSDFNSVMTSFGCPTSVLSSGITCILTKPRASVISRLNTLGYTNCSAKFISVDSLLYADRADFSVSIFRGIFARVPNMRQIVSQTAGFSCGSFPSKSSIIGALEDYNLNYLWDVMVQAKGGPYLVGWFKQNNLSAFLSTIAVQHKNYISTYQQAHNMYSASGNGMAAYFNYLRSSPFNQAFFDNLLQRFYNVSKLYTDSLNLNEWMIYGSSRLGNRQAGFCVASMVFTADVVNGNFSNNATRTSYDAELSLDTFSIWRGKKRYELSNHLGNVLVVITDKKNGSCKTLDLYQEPFNSGTGGFTGGSAGSTLTNNASRLKVVVPAVTNGGTIKTVNTVVGKTYQVNFTFQRGSTVSIMAYAKDPVTTNNLQLINCANTGYYSYTFTATKTTATLGFEKTSNAGVSSDFYIDDVEMKEVLVGGEIAYYDAEVIQANDYSPFGAPMAGRQYNYSTAGCKTCTDLKTVYTAFVASNGAITSSNIMSFVTYANTQLGQNKKQEDYENALKQCKLMINVVNFDGSTTKASTASPVNLNLGLSDITAEAWVYLRSNSGYNSILNNFTVTGGVVRGISLYTYQGKVCAGFFVGGASGNAHVIANSAITLNQWTHVVVTRKQGSPVTFALYINGVSVPFTNSNTDVGDATGMTTTAPFEISYSTYNSGQYWNGYLRNVKLYNRQLSSIEITANYRNGTIGENTTANGLIYHAKLDEGSGTLINDYIAGNNMTLTNNSWLYVANPGVANITTAELAQQVFCDDDTYRFGFNGKERDNETYGDGNEYDFGDRIYNPRLGRWMTIDPLAFNYPALSSYSYAANSPLMFTDLKGRSIKPNNSGAEAIVTTLNLKYSKYFIVVRDDKTGNYSTRPLYADKEDFAKKAKVSKKDKDAAWAYYTALSSADVVQIEMTVAATETTPQTINRGKEFAGTRRGEPTNLVQNWAMTQADKLLVNLGGLWTMVMNDAYYKGKPTEIIQSDANGKPVKEMIVITPDKQGQNWVYFQNELFNPSPNATERQKISGQISIDGTGQNTDQLMQITTDALQNVKGTSAQR